MIYCFSCPCCGTIVEVDRPMKDRALLELCPNDAFVMERDFGAEGSGKRHHSGNWPMESYAAGVGVSQAVEAMEEATKMGVPTQFNTETGDAIFTSAQHRKQYCEAIGLHDLNGGYSDPQKLN